jgi:hypothetical protein
MCHDRIGTMIRRLNLALQSGSQTSSFSSSESWRRRSFLWVYPSTCSPLMSAKEVLQLNSLVCSLRRPLISVPISRIRSQCRHRSHARMCQQPARLWPLSGLRFHFLIKFLDPLLQLRVQTEQLTSSLTGVGWQRYSFQCAPSPRTPECTALSHGVIERDGLQRVLQTGSHPHPLITVAQQGS